MSYLGHFSFLGRVVFSRFFTAAALLLIASTPALAHVRSYAFVPNVGTDSVDVIDTTLNTIETTIPVGDGPRATAITPDGRRVYVVNRNDNTVSVVDVATRTVVGSPIPVGLGPYTIAITPDGRKAYVGNNDGGTVSVLDLTTNTVTTIVSPALAFPNTPIDMVITPDGATVYVVATNSGLVPIDVQTDTAGALIPTGQATCVALHGQTAWVGQMDSFFLVDLSSSTVIDTIPMGNSHYDLAISPNGEYAYAVSSATDSVTVIDTATRTVVATVPVGLDPAAVAFVGTRAYVANASSGTINIIDTASHGIIGVPIPVGGSPAGPGGSFISPNIVVPGPPVTIANDGIFGAVPFGAFVPFNGGPMQATANWTTTRTVSLLAQGGTLDTNGFDVTLAGDVINDGMLTKTGAGTLTLSGTSTHAGGTLVAANGGTLIVNGTHSGQISVGSDATLGGSGTVGDILTSLGTIAPGGLAPGGTIGILHAANMTLWGLAHVNIDLKGGVAGTDYDQIVVSGTAALENAYLTVDETGFSPAPGQQFTIVTNATGVFKLGMEGRVFLGENNTRFRITYMGGDGNDVVLTADMTPPEIIGDHHVTVDEDSGLISVPIAVSDDAFPASQIQTWVESSWNAALLPLANVAIVGAGASRTLRLTPLPNASGATTVVLRAEDGASRQIPWIFYLTVNPVNDPPTISTIAAQSIPENTPLDPIAFTVGDVETDAAALTVTATSSNQSVVPDANLVIGGSGADRTIAAMPLVGVRGDTTITLTVSDGDKTTTTSFVLSVVERTYYLAEGATGSFFDTDILLANPNDAAAPVVIRFLTGDGVSIVETRTLPPTSRTTIRAEEVEGLEATSFATIVTSTNALPIVVERTMRWDASGYGAHTEKATAGAAPVWYFAEGSQGFFSTFLLLANPHATANTAHVTYFREGEPALTRDYPLEPGSRKTIDASADEELVNRSFGARVTFDLPGVAERSMYFGGEPHWLGGHAAAGTTAPAASWFLAEGATGSYFTTFLLLANPNDEPADVTLTYFPASGEPVTKTDTLGGHQRMTRNLALEDATLASAAVATRVESTRPIIAERSQYWGTPSWIEAHNSHGVTSAATRWGLAEGRVGGPDAAQTYILLANPNEDADATATVTLTFLRGDGGTIVKTFTVPPASRFNVGVIPSEESMAPELIDESFGALIESTRPIVVERSLYTNANGLTWSAGTNATATRLP